MELTELKVPGVPSDLARVDEAIAAVCVELESAPDAQQRGLILERLGALYRLAGQPKTAVRAFEGALKAHGAANNGAVTRVYVSMGLALRAAGEHQRALDTWERGIELLTDRALKIIAEEGELLRPMPGPGPRTLLADTGVFARIRELCRLDITFAVLRNNMGVIDAERGKPQQAAEMFREALDFTPEGAHYDHPRINLRLLAEKGA